MKCRCENCNWTGDIEETNPVDDFWERVQPGEIMPAGECPKCRYLAVPTTDNDLDELSSQGRRAIAADDLLKALKNLSSSELDMLSALLEKANQGKKNES